MSQNCNVLTNNYDLHPNRLNDSFMHRKFSGDSAQPIVYEVTLTEADSAMDSGTLLKSLF